MRDKKVKLEDLTHTVWNWGGGIPKEREEDKRRKV